MAEFIAGTRVCRLSWKGGAGPRGPAQSPGKVRGRKARLAEAKIEGVLGTADAVEATTKLICLPCKLSRDIMIYCTCSRLVGKMPAPVMRGRMSPAANYTKGVAIGEVMQGGGVGEVVASNHPAWKAGDIAESMSFGWQEWSV